MQLDTVRTAAWAGYKYFEGEYWQDLSPDDQAYLIAAYQIDQEIQTLMQHEAIEAAKKATRKPRGKP